MGSASRQLKRKQKTSKRDSQMSDEQQVNGEVAPEKFSLSRQQADLFKQLLSDSHEAQNQVQFALVAAGIADRQILTGNLDSQDPYFMLKGANGITRK